MRVGTLMHPREGDEDLSDNGRKDPLADKGKPKARGARRPAGGSTKAGEVGKALRSVYDTTLREDVPDDFLNLLGKLR